MRQLLQKASAYLLYGIIAVIAILAVVLGYQHYATGRAIEQARQPGDMAVFGNADAAVTVVAYIDYNCPPCGESWRVMTQVLQNRRDTRVIVRPLPMLGDKSEAVTRMAIAAALNGNFEAYHHALLDEMERQKSGEQGELSMGRAEALRVARTAGLDSEQLRQTARDERVSAILERNVDTAEQLNIRAVPTYIIGKRLYTPFNEAPKPDDFHRMLDAVQRPS